MILQEEKLMPIMEFQIEEREIRDPVDPELAARALSLLVRWALRKAQKRAGASRATSGRVVSVDFSKDYTGRKPKN